MRHKSDRRFLKQYIEDVKFVLNANEYIQKILENVFFVTISNVELQDMHISFSSPDSEQIQEIKQFCSQESLSYEYSDFTNDFTIRVDELFSCLERLDSKELIQTTLMQDEIANNESIDDRLLRIENMLNTLLDEHNCEKHCCDRYDYTDSW